MKCLTNNQIQQLIDGELPANEKREYKLHIETCTCCAEKYAEQRALAFGIKSLLNAAVPMPERITAFQIPAKPIHQKRISRRIPLWAKVAAVLIPVLFVWKYIIFETSDHKQDKYNCFSRIYSQKTYYEDGETYTIVITDVIYSNKK